MFFFLDWLTKTLWLLRFVHPCLLPVFLWVVGFCRLFSKPLKLLWDTHRRPPCLILGGLDWLLILWARMSSGPYHRVNRWSHRIFKVAGSILELLISFSWGIVIVSNIVCLTFRRYSIPNKLMKKTDLEGGRTRWSNDDCWRKDLIKSFLSDGSALFHWNFFTCLIRFGNDSVLTLPSPSKMFKTEGKTFGKTDAWANKLPYSIVEVQQ